MCIFKVDLLDSYFSDQHELKLPKTVLDPIETFSDSEVFKNVIEKYSDLFDFSSPNPEFLGDRPIQDVLTKIKAIGQQDPRFSSLVMDLLKNAHENIPKMWKSFYFFDEFLFINFSKLMDSIKKEDHPALLKIIEDFQKERANTLSLWLKIQSLLGISEVKAEVKLKLDQKSLTLRDLDSKRWDLIQRLNQESIEAQEAHVHQWCREFGSLIEGQLKRIIFFISLINKLITTKKRGSIGNYKSMSVHDVLSLFSKDFTKFKNIENLLHFRNSSNHETYSWKSSQVIENSTIQFVDRTWKETISFEKLILIYYKIVFLVSTFELVVMNKQLSLLDESRTIDEIYKDIGSQLFQQREKIFREWFENDKTG